MFFTMDEVALIDGLIATYFVADSVSESVRVRYYDIKVKREVLKLAQLMLGLFCCSKTISYQ